MDGDEVEKVVPEKAGDEGGRAEKDFETELRYLAAEFDNFKKRAARERQMAAQGAVEKMVAELLPVLDDFDAAVATLAESGCAEGMLEGIGMVRKKLVKALEAKGMRRIETSGRKFEVGLHEAAGFEETDSVPEGTVAREVQAGYSVGDTVVRHAKVIVAKRPAKTEGAK